MSFADYDPGPPIVAIASTILVVVSLCLIVPASACIIWRKRRAGKIVSRVLEKYSINTITERNGAFEGYNCLSIGCIIGKLHV